MKKGFTKKRGEDAENHGGKNNWRLKIGDWTATQKETSCVAVFCF